MNGLLNRFVRPERPYVAYKSRQARGYKCTWGPTWIQVGLQNRSKIEEKAIQKSIEKTMYLGIDFLKDFDGFLNEKWRYVGTNIEKKSMPTSKSDFLTKRSFTLGKTMILRVQGVEVGSQNRSKIDQKTKSTWEGILASIFHRFWWILGAKLGGKIEPRSIKNGIEKMTEKRKAAR